METHPHHWLGRNAVVALLSLGTLACVTEVRRPVAVVYDNGDYEYESYPRYVYDGRAVFLVGDRWYYQDGGVWSYYRSEPAGLWQYRSDYYSTYGYQRPPAYGAPPAYRGRYGGAPPAVHSAPPAYGAPGRNNAPPAYGAPGGHSAPPAGHNAPPAHNQPPTGHQPQPGNNAPPAGHGPPAYGAPPGQPPPPNQPPPKPQQQQKKRQEPIRERRTP